MMEGSAQAAGAEGGGPGTITPRGKPKASMNPTVPDPTTLKSAQGGPLSPQDYQSAYNQYLKGAGMSPAMAIMNALWPGSVDVQPGKSPFVAQQLNPNAFIFPHGANDIPKTKKGEQPPIPPGMGYQPGVKQPPEGFDPTSGDPVANFGMGPTLDAQRQQYAQNPQLHPIHVLGTILQYVLQSLT